VLVIRRRSGEAILGAEIVMLGRVRMTRQAQRVGTAGEKLQKVGAIGGVGPGVVRVEIIAQRDVHRRNDQFVGRRFLEHVGDERQLPLADAAFVKARRIGPRRVGAQIVDIVEHQKQCAAIFERVGGRAESPLEGLARIARVRRLEIEVVIAADIVPRHADLTDDAVEPRVERQVVEHDVAGGDAESGRMIADQAGHHIVADEVDFGRAFRLRIGEEEHIEFLRLIGFLQCEVNRVRQRAAGIDAAIAQLQALRRACGLVNVVEARQHLLVDRHRIAGWA
jgi:hypothetical protein